METKGHVFGEMEMQSAPAVQQYLQKRGVLMDERKRRQTLSRRQQKPLFIYHPILSVLHSPL